MEIKEFLENFVNQFEETDPSLIKPETIFRDLEEWGSMSVLSIIAMADEEYGVELEPEDFKKAQTVQDLFEIIKSKKG
ncbi:MAG: acyl carrier protein [Muribaculaceae bacterium]|nr:acyl carrier protein [Muribaculaceae bacterium]